MEDAAYVHIHGRSHIRMAWETHYVGDLRSVNVVPVDNYQLKSQDIVSLPSPINLTKAATVVRKEVMRDGREAVCFINRAHQQHLVGGKKFAVPSLQHRSCCVACRGAGGHGEAAGGWRGEPAAAPAGWSDGGPLADI